MRVLDIVNYLKAADDVSLPFSYYPNEFMTTTPDDSVIIRITSGRSPSQWTTKKYPSFQALVRSNHPSKAETKAYEIRDKLHLKTEFTIGTTKVVGCFADQSEPMFIGKDDNNRILYSVNFTCTTLGDS